MSLIMFDIVAITSPEEYTIAAELFKEYAQWLGIDLSFQGFNEELLEISVMYAQPRGNCWLAYQQNQAIGCIALRPINGQTAELKRMYVIPDLQRKGVGQQLLDVASKFALDQGYSKLRLDTLKSMEPAMNLYRKNGFLEIPAYYHNPHPQAVYFEKQLVRLNEK